ncbi:phosphodiesterase [Agrobacterium tumefaciens]|uniref:phosphodiesterase n=1 Tax=Agrobacterium tumefaciens TaxID=358 RepID=UPI0015741B05|nr:phosphodiesterase [Agrobacterium tumefaciens]
MKIIQITDTHLLPPGIAINGVDPEKQLRAAISDIVEKHPDADLLVMTGDLCNYGEPEAYELLRDILAPVSLPVRLMLGNHDRRPEFVAAFPEQPRDENGYIQSFIDTAFGRLLFLDSHEADVIGGMYGADRLTWLDKALEGAGDLPVTVFVHHPPMDCGIRHFENIGMHDDGAVMQRLGRHPAGVRHIVFGHIHVPMAGTSAEGIAYSSGQACAHRFITDIEVVDPLWTGGNPCYRVISLGTFGLRAYDVEVGQVVLGQASACEGP